MICLNLIYNYNLLKREKIMADIFAEISKDVVANNYKNK